MRREYAAHLPAEKLREGVVGGSLHVVSSGSSLPFTSRPAPAPTAAPRSNRRPPLQPPPRRVVRTLSQGALAGTDAHRPP
jgi:hypothetical protein